MGTTEDEMVGWHHPLNGHGFGWTPGVGDGQGVPFTMAHEMAHRMCIANERDANFAAYLACMVHSEGNQSWVFIGRTDVEAEIPILWPPHAKS